MKRTKLFCILVALGALAAPALAKQPAVGQPAPPFRLKTIDGEEVSLDSLRGDVVVLNFWATWCAPCREELPLLDGYFALRKDAGLRIFAITTEDSLSPQTVRRKLPKLSLPLVTGIRGPYAALGAVPTSYVIDRAGVIRYAKAAAFDLDTLNALLVPLLNEAAPATTAAK